jgi:hypothetical protein
LLPLSASSPLSGSKRDIQLSRCANQSIESKSDEKGNVIPPKVHNTSVTESKDTQIAEMPKNSKVYFYK